MKNLMRIQLTLFTCLLISLPIQSQPGSTALRQGIEWGISHHYDRALALFDSLAVAFPQHPAPPFYRAAIFQSMMLDYETNAWQDTFYHSIEESIRLSKLLLRKEKQDASGYFYAGAAYAYKSAQLARDGKYWHAYRAIQTSLDYLNPLLRQDSSYCDALLGIGTYQYWRSRFTKNLSWLPLFPDHRQQGIDKIIRVSRCAQLSQSSAWSNLTWIYIRENKFKESIHYARLGLDAFPQSRFFLWPLAEAQFLDHNYQDASTTYQLLLKSTRDAPVNNGYNELVILWKLAQCAEKLGDLTEAQKKYQEVVHCRVDEEVSKRAENNKNMARKWLEKF